MHKCKYKVLTGCYSLDPSVPPLPLEILQLHQLVVSESADKKKQFHATRMRVAYCQMYLAHNSLEFLDLMSTREK